MRKSRLITLALLLIAVAVCWWGWRDRDQVVPWLVNPWLGGDRIRSAQGLQLSADAISAESLEILLASGASIQLRDLRLRHPLGTLFGGEDNRSQLTITGLTYYPAPAPLEPDDEAATEIPRAEAEPELYFSELLQLLRRRLPRQIDIDQLQWAGPERRSGRLSLRREGGDTIRGTLYSGDLEARWQLLTRDTDVRLRARISSATGESVLQLDGSATRQEKKEWQGELRLQAELEQLAALPPLAGAVTGAGGEFSLRIESQFPDQLLNLEGYRRTVARLSAKSLHFPLPEDPIGMPLQLSADTLEPLSVDLASLWPLTPRQLSGSANIRILSPGTEGTLLELQLGARTPRDAPLLTANGNLDLRAAAPLFQSARWREALSPVAVSSPEGNLSFRGTAELLPLAEMNAQRRRNPLRRFTVTLLPEGSAKAVVGSSDGDSLLAQLGWNRGTAELQLPAPVTIVAARWPGPVQVETETVQIRAREAAETLSLDTTLKNIRCRLEEDIRCTLFQESAISRLEFDGIDIRQLQSDGQLEFSRKDEQQQLRLINPSLSTGEIRTETVQVKSATLESAEVECTRHKQDFKCFGASAGIELDALSGPDFQLKGVLALNDLHFASAAGQLRTRARYRSDELQLRARNQYQLKASVAGDLTAEGNRLSGNNRLRSGALAIESEWRYQLDSDAGSATFTLEPATFSQQQPLSDSIEGLPVDLVAGELSAKGRLSWPAAQRDFLDARLDKVAAVYGDVFAVGITGQLSSGRKGDNWIASRPQPFTAETLDIGVPVENIRLAVSLDDKRDLVLTGIRAELLDGALEARELRWNLDGEPRSGLVNFSGISLRTLTRELETENFAATGTVDLQIPLHTGDEGITVKQGRIEARPPGGRLRYYGAFSADMLSANPQLKLVAGALEDYNYRELSGTVEYPPSGDMQMQLKLVGRSESVAADRDLIINLNLENNIPAMLRSLQASRDLTEALEKQL
ncbi:intermembrane phospholipid transport protein YdbH family protein [Microbulbifer sp.]|uniref:YdbH domain-containing protein n=1 Tax=Microbulbifer sp. TaxID=1908541 RepID=UPI003F2D5DFE